MNRQSFIFMRSFAESLSYLQDSDRLAMYDAIVAYGLDGTMPPFDGIMMSAFSNFKFAIDDDNNKRESISSKRRAAGSIGGKQTQANPSKSKQTEANASKDEQKEKDKEQEIKEEKNLIKKEENKEKDKEKESVCEAKCLSAPHTLGVNSKIAVGDLTHRSTIKEYCDDIRYYSRAWVEQGLFMQHICEPDEFEKYLREFESHFTTHPVVFRNLSEAKSKFAYFVKDRKQNVTRNGTKPTSWEQTKTNYAYSVMAATNGAQGERDEY